MSGEAHAPVQYAGNVLDFINSGKHAGWGAYDNPRAPKNAMKTPQPMCNRFSNHQKAYDLSFMRGLETRKNNGAHRLCQVGNGDLSIIRYIMKAQKPSPGPTSLYAYYSQLWDTIIDHAKAQETDKGGRPQVLEWDTWVSQSFSLMKKYIGNKSNDWIVRQFPKCLETKDQNLLKKNVPKGVWLANESTPLKAAHISTIRIHFRDGSMRNIDFLKYLHTFNIAILKLFKAYSLQYWGYTVLPIVYHAGPCNVHVWEAEEQKEGDLYYGNSKCEVRVTRTGDIIETRFPSNPPKTISIVLLGDVDEEEKEWYAIDSCTDAQGGIRVDKLHVLVQSLGVREIAFADRKSIRPNYWWYKGLDVSKNIFAP